MDKKRIIAFLIDYSICCLIQGILMMTLIFNFILKKTASENNFIVSTLAITFISTLFLIFRDCLGKKSIGKRIMKLKIINIKNGNSVGFARRVLRNITWLLGPIEIICFLSTGQRIGDILAKTTVKE